MCVPADARVPHLPGTEHRTPGERVTLTASDGNVFAAHVSVPAEPGGAAVVLLPDVRGLFSFYEELADCFAAVGVTCVAIDYFGRTSDIDDRSDDWEFWPHVEQTTPAQVNADVRAAVDHVRTVDPGARVHTVGFCFGGGHSFAQAAAGHGLAGVVGFYGPPRRKRDNFADPISLAPSFECPVLGLFGGADEGIPLADVEAFDTTLSGLGVEHELHVYPGAPHSFFDRTFADHSAECTDAWQRVLALIAR